MFLTSVINLRHELINKVIILSSFYRFKEWNFFKSEEEGNTGFYHVRSNPKTIKLWADVVARSQLPE